MADRMVHGNYAELPDHSVSFTNTAVPRLSQHL